VEGKRGRPDGPPQGLMRRTSGRGTGADDLRAFRERLFGCLVQRADALFKLRDAVLAASNARDHGLIGQSYSPECVEEEFRELRL